MGSDDLFKKRKARSASDIERKTHHRRIAERVLIVCEGEKTEVFYFKDFCEDLRLSTWNVRVEPGGRGSSPDRVVAYALELYENDARFGEDRYDHVYCVMDRDEHATFDHALTMLQSRRGRGAAIQAITSFPCFEYWFLCHFEFTRRPFSRSGGKSSCDEVIARLRGHPGFEDYEKGRRGVYALLKERMETAVANAGKACVQACSDGSANPSTAAHVLVAKLSRLGE